MRSYLLYVSSDGRIKLPKEIVAALGEKREIRIIDEGHYCKLTLPDGNPIYAPVEPVRPDLSVARARVGELLSYRE